jgi:hypothetical protein
MAGYSVLQWQQGSPFGWLMTSVLFLHANDWDSHSHGWQD